VHHRREFRDGAAAQVVAVGKAAGEDNRVDVAELGGVVPNEFGRLWETAYQAS